MRRLIAVSTLGWLLVIILGTACGLGWGGLWWALRSDPYRPTENRRQ
ncbi:hypothetical protein SEA_SERENDIPITOUS_47 [Mycobacterium phage Serendipitous]|uniref:Lipoprotein n=1 Tax=Mycobacterium phage Serendipitous TaxID=2301619 RepID=A0A385UGE0_9CAUD|nr:hypothetical protein I5G64_gp47 [Mycobacterium phage Serendipitous]AYB70588.1 hypothetical protein SEA_SERENDIPITOUS_47 [Mycobacterium phage Serendipitous]